MSECKCQFLDLGRPVGMADKHIGDSKLFLDMHGFIFADAVCIGATLSTPKEEYRVRTRIKYCPYCGRRLDGNDCYYYEKTKQRLDDYTAQMNLFDFLDGKEGEE